MIRNLLDNAWIDNRIKKEKIVHEVYINYEKQLMFIGRANMEENICVFYAFECFLDRENVEEATKHILWRNMLICSQAVVLEIGMKQMW